MDPLTEQNKLSYPRGNVLYRKLRHQFPKIVRGEGIYLFDDASNRYLDGSGGAFVVNAGHGNREIASAMAAQAERLAYVSGLQFTNEPVEELAQELCAIAPRGLTKAFFLNSGSEATDAAIKLARQYWLAQGKTRKTKIISRLPSYHGNTLGAMGVSGRVSYRAMFDGLYVDHPKIPPPLCYRCPWEKTFPQCDYECAGALESEIIKCEPETVAAFMAEPILGSTGGAMVPPAEYYPRIKKICERYDVLFIADEILCGMGRTGDWWGINSYDVSPDILLAGKALTSGYAPLSALLVRDEIIEAIYDTGMDFMHNQTFAHHPVACAAGLATIRFIKQNRLIEKCGEMGKVLHEELKSLRDHELVGDIRGKGLLAGIEIVADKSTRRPFSRERKIAEKITAEGLARGLAVWTNVGHVDGATGDLILLAPPFIIQAEQVKGMMTLLRNAMDGVAAHIKQ
jgi:hypothetical protein